MGRQVLLQTLTFGGGIVLARVLEPAQFGLYVIASFLVSAFALFGDFGLAPSLIQRKEELTELDLHVGFTLQQIVTSVIVVLLLALAPWLAHLYPKAPPETVWLVRALAFNLYLTSWRTMSALQLERHLNFDRLARIEVLEVLIYQGTAVGLVLTEHGVWSYVYAMLASGLLGNLLVYGASPWRIRFAYDKSIARQILHFGIPFQLQSISNSVGGWVTPLLVGSLIGPQAVGYLSWASSNGKKPLILTDIVMRVAYPHFSRIQDDRAEVERILTRYLAGLLLLAGFWFVLLLVAGSSIVEVLYTKKWLPGVAALIIYAAALVFDMVSWVLGVTLNGLGQVNFTTRVVLCRTIASTALAIPLVLLKGFIGVPIAYLIGSALTIPWLFLGFGKGAFTRIIAQVVWITIPVLGSMGMGWISLYFSAPIYMHAILSTLVVVLSYSLLTYLGSPAWLKTFLLINLKRRTTLNVALATGAGE